MKKKIRLTPDQKKLVENHLSIVHWIIRENISVNDSIYGFEYDDLYQEGCIWLCHAAASYNAGLAKFPTYAKKVVRNGLLSYCRKMYAEQKHFIRLAENENGELLNGCPAGHRPDTFTFRTGTMEVLELLTSTAKDFRGVSKLGTEALALKVQGFATSEIAARYHAPPSHVGAWISRASQKLRDSPSFLSGLLY
nr:sigma-70 family RNA polymerase sigma factor [uncultured Acetatifactor sp.]